MKAIIKKVGQLAEVVEIENTLKAMQTVVGGYIEIYPMPYDKKVDLVFNEEGKFGLQPNVAFPEINDILFGDILVVGVGRQGANIGLDKLQARQAIIWLNMRGI